VLSPSKRKVVKRLDTGACSGALRWPIVHSSGRCGGANPPALCGGRSNMQTTVVCSQCDQPETKCECDRYCCYCQGQQDIRLCADGKYYCPDCREACEIALAQDNA
jgi:hypothetical protein